MAELPENPLTCRLLIWPPTRCACCLPLWLFLPLELNKMQFVMNTGKVTVEKQTFHQQLTNLSEVVCFLHFLLSASFEASR